jgi:phenylacetate-CoA ligase
LLTEAYKYVPWYRYKFDSADINVAEIRSEEQFQKVPTLKRSELSNNFQKFVSENIDLSDLKLSTTGGSTGHPLKIGMDPKAVREIPKWQMFSWWGLSPADNIASLYRGVPLYGSKKLIKDFIEWPQKVVHMDATNISTKTIEAFLKDYSEKKPKLIHGYVGALDAIADYLLKNRIQLPAPEVIWSTAAPITKIQENKISEAFGAPVCDQYGCSELYFIAAECSHKEGLHIFADSVKVEILDEKNRPVPKGEYGKIVVTNLNDTSFPLIRYENGDEGRLLDETCSCGLTLPLMDKVKGRVSDNIELHDGTILSGEYLTTIFDDYTDVVNQFQVIQHKTGDITVKIVSDSAARSVSNVIKKVETELQKRILHQVRLEFQVVDDIVQQRGKIQFIIKE